LMNLKLLPRAGGPTLLCTFPTFPQVSGGKSMEIMKVDARLKTSGMTA